MKPERRRALSVVMRSVLALVLVASLSGCGSLLALANFGPGRFGVGKVGEELPYPYKGVVFDAIALGRGFIPALLDLPLSLALDTALLPFTLPTFLVKRVQAWRAAAIAPMPAVRGPSASPAPVDSARWPGMALGVDELRLLACEPGRPLPLRIVGPVGRPIQVWSRARRGVLRGLMVQGQELLTPERDDEGVETFRLRVDPDPEGVVEVTLLPAGGGAVCIEGRATPP